MVNMLEQAPSITYPASFLWREGDSFLVQFIDFPEAVACFSGGWAGALAESKKMLLDTLLFRLTNGDEIPRPTGRDDMTGELDGEVVDVKIDNIVFSTDEYLSQYYYKKIIGECMPLREKIKEIDRPKKGRVISVDFSDWEKSTKKASSAELRFFSHLASASPQMKEMIRLLAEENFDLERFIGECRRRYKFGRLILRANATNHR